MTALSRSVARRRVRRGWVPWVWWQVPTVHPGTDRLRERACLDRCVSVTVDDHPVRVMLAGPMVTGPQHWAPVARAILAERAAGRRA